MTESELVTILDRVANRLARRFRFGYHDLDDMKQQARLFALEALPKYDGVRPLENFLWTHAHNRLCNFKRDKYERLDKPCAECGNCIYDDTSEDRCVKYESLEDCQSYRNWLERNRRKKNILQPITFDSIDDRYEHNMSASNTSDTLVYAEMLEIIDRELPLILRPLYLRLKFGNKLTKTQKIKVQGAVQEILEKHGYHS